MSPATALVAVNFHYVRPGFSDPYPGIHGVTTDEFRAQLEVLARVGSFVTASEVAAACRGQGSLPERAILVTFDDGLREQYENALPVLDEMGVPAVFYVSTRPRTELVVEPVHQTHLLRATTPPAEFAAAVARVTGHVGAGDMLPDEYMEAARQQYRYDSDETRRVKYFLNFILDRRERDGLISTVFEEKVGRDQSETVDSLYMSLEQIRELAGRGMIGNHGHAHVPLGTLPASEAVDQVSRSTRIIEEWTGSRPASFSYPYGSEAACTGEVADALAAEGYDFALTMERAVNRDLGSPMMLSRLACNDAPGGSHERWSEEAFFDDAPTREWLTGEGTGR